jgi:hypothetical protein
MNITILKSIHFKALIVLVALFSSLSSAMADTGGSFDCDRIFQFTVKNGDTKPVEVTLIPGSCYEGLPRVKTTIIINVGEEYEMTIARIQGHGCDGKYGYFALQFSPAIGLKSTQNFRFNNNGDMALEQTNNAYTGTLNPKEGCAFSYTTAKTPDASKVIGQWQSVCSNKCDVKVTTEVEYSENSIKKVSTSVTNALSASVTAGVEYGAYSGEATVSASTQETLNESMQTSITKTGKVTSENLGLSNDDMVKYGIHAVWQYVGVATYSGSTMHIKTTYFTYTTGPGKPDWLPLSDKDVQHNLSHLIRK